MPEWALLAPYGGGPLFVAYIGLGLAVGFIAWRFGVGGGLIIVPALIFVFHAQGLAAGMEPQLALGTSLASILFTSLSSVRAHHRYGAVEWRLVLRMAPDIALGTLTGAVLAAQLAATALKLFSSRSWFSPPCRCGWITSRCRIAACPGAPGSTWRVA